MDSFIFYQPPSSSSKLTRERAAAVPHAKPAATTFRAPPVSVPIQQRTEPVIAELLSEEWKAKNSRDYSLNHDGLGSQSSAAACALVGSRDSAAIAYDTSRLCTGTEDLFITPSDNKGSDSEPSTNLDAAVTAAASGDGNDLSVSTPSTGVDTPPSTLPAVLTASANTILDHSRPGQILVRLADSSVIHESNNRDNIQASQNVDYDITGDVAREKDVWSGEDVPSLSSHNPFPTAAEGSIYDVFAEYEETFGDLSTGQRPGKNKKKGLSARSAMCLSTSASEIPAKSGFGLDESNRHIARRGLATTMPVSPFPRYSSNEPVDDKPKAQKPRRQRQTPTRTQTLPAPLSRKRRALSAGSKQLLRDDSRMKRPRRSRKPSAKAAAVAVVKGSSDLPAAPGEKTAGHAFPRHYLDKAWRVEDLDDVYLAEDGSLRCVVIWQRSDVAATDLAGEVLLKRKEVLFKEKYGTERWEKWLNNQGLARRGRW